MKRMLAVVIVIVLGVAACSAYVPTSTPTPPGVPPVQTPTPVVPSPTPTPTPTPPLPAPTPSPEPRPPTETPTPPVAVLPESIADLISRLSHEPVSDPPSAIFRYEYKGQAVYYLPPRCCDQFSDLYDAAGNLLGHPDGGITGRGDGKFPDFFQERKNERAVWQDARKHNPNLTLTKAPIESVKVIPLEGAPGPVDGALVVSGLPNGCVTFAGYRLQRRQDTIDIELLNWAPANPRTICTQVYGTVETTIVLGSSFERGKTYTVTVNDVSTTFVAR